MKKVILNSAIAVVLVFTLSLIGYTVYTTYEYHQSLQDIYASRDRIDRLVEKMEWYVKRIEKRQIEGDRRIHWKWEVPRNRIGVLHEGGIE